ncbi:hypothetical protein L7F22_008876 [Adiantum nelumboides]|nr:hypothetical protein [Adiantum nelumboides]
MPNLSKRVTRASDKREDEAKPTPEVAMEDATKDKKVGKPRGLAYKLKSKVDMTIDLQMVSEERNLNGKIELTLGELLGIAKPKFHAKFSNMVKRKQHISVKTYLENLNKAQHIEAIIGRWFEELDEDEPRLW